MRARTEPKTATAPSCVSEGLNGRQGPAVGFTAWFSAFRRRCRSGEPKERAACEELLQLVPDPGDRAMVHELYLQRQPVEKVAYDHAYSRSGLYRRVHKAMKEVYKAQE